MFWSYSLSLFLFFLLYVKTIKRKNDPKSRRFGIPKSNGCREIHSAIDDFVGPYIVVVVVVSYKGKIVWARISAGSNKI